MMPISDEQMATFVVFMRTHAIVTTALDREMIAEVGMPITWFEVLVYLSASPGRRMRMRDLAQMIVLTRSGLTRLIDRLEKAEFTKREPCPGDRRGTFIAITPEGISALRRCRPGHLSKIGEHLFRHLDDDDVRALYAILLKVLVKETGEKQQKLVSSFLSKILGKETPQGQRELLPPGHELKVPTGAS